MTKNISLGTRVKREIHRGKALIKRLEKKCDNLDECLRLYSILEPQVRAVRLQIVYLEETWALMEDDFEYMVRYGRCILNKDGRHWDVVYE